MRRLREWLGKAARGIFQPFGLQLTYARSPTSGIGMAVCLNGLRLRGFVPGVVLDVGAASGSWTELAMTFWPNSRYTLVEPLEERRPQLTALSRRARNVNWLQVGLGAATGELGLGVSPDSLDGSSLVYEGSFSRKIPIATIDVLLAEGRMDQPDFIKIDVQGYELEVLKGGASCLEACELILVELEFFRFAPAMPLLHEVIAWMVDHEYRPYEVADVLRRPSDGAMGQCDLLFCRKNHWLLRNDTW